MTTKKAIYGKAGGTANASSATLLRQTPENLAKSVASKQDNLTSRALQNATKAHIIKRETIADDVSKKTQEENHSTSGR